MSLGVVIPTTHRVEEVQALVTFIEQTSPETPVVVVVDNGPDATLGDWDLARSHRIVVAEEYMGSEAAFVRGAADLMASPPTWTLFLDHDAILATDTLRMLLDTARGEGCVYSANHGGRGNAWTSRDLVGWADAPAVRVVQEVELAPWSGLLVPAAALAIVVALDSAYWFGWDDCLLCCRLRDAGFPVMAVADAKVLNERRGGEYLSAWRAYYSKRNQVLSFCESMEHL